MKKALKIFLLCCIAALCAFSAVACTDGKTAPNLVSTEPASETQTETEKQTETEIQTETETETETETKTETQTETETETETETQTETETATATETETETETETATAPETVTETETETETQTETETATETATETVTETETETEAYGIMLDELKAANDLQTVLKKYGSLYIRDTVTSEGDIQFTTESSFSVNDYGPVMDIVVKYPDFNYYVSAINGMNYTYFEGDYYRAEVIAGDYDSFLRGYLSIDPQEDLNGTPELRDGKIALDSIEVFDEKTYSLTVYFNPETLLIESIVAVGDGVYYEAFYTYGIDFTAEMTAYKAHQNAENKWEFAIVRNPGTEGEKMTRYTVAADSDIVACGSDDVEYALYENMSCTRVAGDIDSVMQYNKYPILYIGEVKPDVLTFEYTYTAADGEEFNALLAEFESLALDDTASLWDVQKAYEYMSDKIDYIVSQFLIANIVYDKDNTAEWAWIEFMEVYNTYYSAITDVNDVFRRLYEADAKYNEELFRYWTQAEIDALMGKNTETDEKLSKLNLENEEICRAIESLKQDKDWVSEASKLYEKLVSNNKQIATLNGSESYIEYSNYGVYRRDWNTAEIESFIKYVKQYIAPLYRQLQDRVLELENKLDIEKIMQAEMLGDTAYSELEIDYVKAYFDSFDAELGEYFRNLFEKNAAVFVKGDNGSGTAYTNYFDYYGEPFCVFGSGGYYQSAYTVVHESGHYASLYNYNMYSLSYDLAETQSQANEYLFLAFLKDYFDEDVYEYCVVSKVCNDLWSVILDSIIYEFENEVYSAATPYTADDYAEILAGLCKEYGVEEYSSSVTNYTLYVATISPCYYISYGVSLVSCLDLFVTATDDYAEAQEFYGILQVDAAETYGFKAALAMAGIGSPFNEETFIKITQMFGSLTDYYDVAVEDAVDAEGSEIMNGGQISADEAAQAA